MENKKFNLGNKALGAGKSAMSTLGKAKDKVVKAIDQNDDGELNLEDVTIVAGALGNVAKNTASTIKTGLDAKSKEIERNTLRPIFMEDLDRADFAMTKLICVSEMDKKHAESEICEGSIGHESNNKDLKFLTLYRNNLDVFGLTFYPDADCDFYYVDPSDRDTYIALDYYFTRLKEARVNELQLIAQSLGATHFRVTYKEEQTSFTKSIKKVKIGSKGIGNAEAEVDTDNKEMSRVEIAAEMDCTGHDPILPKMSYLQRDVNIQTLIQLRMNDNGTLHHQKYTLNLSNTSGIKERDAVKIDAVIKGLKLSGNSTVTSEVRNEARRYFEYEIDFD